jgi:hypothetical protein
MTQLTNNVPLSPIILSKSYAEEKKISVQATIKKSIFSIYQIVSGTPQSNYCNGVLTYLSNNESNNDYYKCNNCILSADDKETKYMVIEFANPSNIITVDDIPYTVKKITFHTPTYHLVYNDSKYDPESYPSLNEPDVNRELNSINDIPGKIKNCLEIEILCDNLIQKLSISILCNTSKKKDDWNDDTIESFTDEDGVKKPFFGLIYKYIKNTSDSQLSAGGYKDKSYTLNITDLLPTNKQFFKYNGTAFETNPNDNSFTKVTRMVFNESITIPKLFFEKIKDLTSTSNSSCSNNNYNRQVNQFIEYQTDVHKVIFSDTNIDYVSKDHVPKKEKKLDMEVVAVAILVCILFILIIVGWMWSRGMIQRILREIFKDSPLILSVLITL